MKTFEKTIISLHGEKGRQWISNLPNIINNLAKQWDLLILAPYENLTYHFAIRVLKKETNQHAVLKIGLDQNEMQQEITALQFYNGNGCVTLLEHNINFCALLIEQAKPGYPLTSYFPNQDAKATRYAYKLMKGLHSMSLPENQYQFRDIQREMHALYIVDSSLIPRKLQKQAQNWAHELIESQIDRAVLHGDLHQGNILSTNGSTNWIAIDPKGIIGEPAYEMSVFIYNPINILFQQPNVHLLIQSRINTFSQLAGIERERIRKWAFVRAMLSACWNIQDNMNPETFLIYARLIQDQCI